ncbi:MAG: lactate utilization protein [Candidatus Lokiarchaeota archaeon]|nr:lactate utilization protein [Candidatus Lokiarchaeota archaeon]
MEDKHPEFKDGEKKYYDALLKRVKSSLRKNGMKAKIFENSKEAIEYVMRKLKDGDVVGVGGSRTLLQIGMIDELIKSDKIKFLNRWREDITPKEELETRYKNLSADVFMMSTNAVTVNGKLINIDGMGNRVSAMIFGPKKVYFFVGRNKIVKDVQAGIDRVRNEAAPKNAARYNLNLPCTEDGVCDEENCYGARICNFVVIIERGFMPWPSRLNVMLINEDLGF